MKDVKVTKIVKVNDAFVDVYYTFKGLIFKGEDRVSIHINHWPTKRLDAYNMLSEKYHQDINNDQNLIRLLKEALRLKGYSLV
tara:strand:- start:176 stop:424 length:249 start_codon:yes stop_codon:yes gene_type:complete